MIENELILDDGEVGADPTEEEVLANRLRWAAESLTIEFHEVSQAEAERLIFDVTREFLSEAKVAQFIPTFATRRARQLLRDRQAAGIPPAAAASEPAPDLEVILVDEDPIAVDYSSGPPRPPAYYADEAKRLLERAKVLRATAPLPAGPKK